MRYRNDVIQSVLLHIRTNLGMMLTRNYASCHAARSTLVMLLANNVQKLRWPAKSLDLNPIERKFWAQPLQLNIRELTRVIHQMYSAIPQQYTHRHSLSMSSQFLAVDATPGGCTKY